MALKASLPEIADKGGKEARIENGGANREKDVIDECDKK